MSEWQPIETAPKDGTRVVLWRGYPSMGVWSEMTIAEWRNDAWWWPDPSDTPSTHGDWSDEDMERGFFSDSDFTHWMPLPQPPEKTK